LADVRTTLAATPAFADLDPALAAELLAGAPPRTLEAGERLFAAGEEFRGEVYVLERGRLEVRRVTGEHEHPPPGYLVGLSSFLADSPYASTAVALEECLLRVIPAAHLRALERRRPELFDALNRLIARRLREQTLTPVSVSAPLAVPVSRAMSAPLVSCPADGVLREAVERMLDANVGSLAVLDSSGTALGLLTFRSLTQRLLRPGADPERIPAREAYREAAQVPVSTPLWQAQERLRRDGVKHLLVTDGGRAVGILSQTDIIRLLASRLGAATAAIESAADCEALHRRYLALAEVARDALESNRHARAAVEVLSSAHLAVQRRCVELTLAAIEHEGGGLPPGRFALIVMGSGGRREMMLDPDQDNGIILADGLEREGLGWFERFCARLNENLDRVGYRLCPGEIMARNPLYRKTLGAWRRQITRLTRHPSDKAARWSNIVFDFDTLHGDDRLTVALREHVHRSLRADPRLLQFMVEDDAQGRAPINLFNRLVATGRRDGVETVDVKRNGLRIVADAARIFALREGVASCNTSDRLAALVRRGVLSADFEATVRAAYDELLEILLVHQIRRREQGQELDKEVAPEDLSPPEREALRVAMRAVKRFQDHLQDTIGGTS